MCRRLPGSGNPLQGGIRIPGKALSQSSGQYTNLRSFTGGNSPVRSVRLKVSNFASITSSPTNGYGCLGPGHDSDKLAEGKYSLMTRG